jgi:hypothetical protein
MKTVSAMVLCLVAVVVLAVPAPAAAASVPLYTLSLNPDCGNTSGSGSVELRDSTAPNSMEMKLVLTGALPNRSYDVIWYSANADYTNPSNTTAGKVNTNEKGNAKFVYTPSVAAAGDYAFRIDLRLDGTLSQYVTGNLIITFTNGMPLQIPLQLRCGNTSGGGYVALSHSKAPNSMQMELVLTGALPTQSYDVIWYSANPDYTNPSNTTVGTVLTDVKGDADFVCTLSLPAAGDYYFRIDLREKGGVDDTLLQYSTNPLTITIINSVPLRIPLELRCGNTSGGGHVALHDSTVPNSVEMKLVLKGALPTQSYDVIWYSANPDYTNSSETTVGTVQTNNKGNASLVRTLSVAAAGDYIFRIDLREKGGVDDTLLQYSTNPLTVSIN